MQQEETASEKEKIIDLLEKWKTIEITNYQKKISSKLQLITCDNKTEARDNDGPKHKSSSDIFSHMLSMWQALTGQALLKKRLDWWIEVFWSHEENPAAYQHIMHMLHLFIKLLTQELCKKTPSNSKFPTSPSAKLLVPDQRRKSNSSYINQK